MSRVVFSAKVFGVSVFLSVLCCAPHLESQRLALPIAKKEERRKSVVA